MIYSQDNIVVIVSRNILSYLCLQLVFVFYIAEKRISQTEKTISDTGVNNDRDDSVSIQRSNLVWYYYLTS